MPGKRLVATKAQKFFFWMILGSLSVLFAEVIAGSSAFPFFTAWGILVVFPLYALHTLFFFYLIYNYGKPTLAVLFSAGMLFGMYEAYMTKVVWISYIPTGPLVSLGGIALFETLLLVLFWHSILAFSIPLLVGETHLTRSKDIICLLPDWIRRRGLLLFFILLIFGGVFTSLNSPSILRSFLSTATSGAVVLLLMYIWKRKGFDRHQIQDLMPSKRAFKIITGLLIAMYVVLLIIINFNRIPGLGPQAIVWLIYAVLIFLFVKNLKISRLQKPNKLKYSPVSTRASLLYLGIFVFSAIIGEILHIDMLLVLFSFLLVAFPGLPLLFYSIFKARSSHKT